VRADLGKLRGGGCPCELLGHRALQDAPRAEDLARLAHRRLCDECPARGQQRHQLQLGELEQCLAHLGPADAEHFSQALLAELGAGGKAMLRDRRGHAAHDVVGRGAARAADRRVARGGRGARHGHGSSFPGDCIRSVTTRQARIPLSSFELYDPFMGHLPA